ncbi:hypothetical protein LTR37_003133 [Vermiconidia calcicola]|uniref:Uncharacterized protein n=1 Tax=Vermiconidia calcicola TaxID=1690605 RepID=A0ACC3NR07_9PEZI|nr:hypothetical protein LTR37_003133 [Vermiconidia calcicola]
MAELVGGVSAVLTMAEIGFSLANTLYQYASSVKGAEKDIRAIAKDVELTSKVLRQTHEQIKQDQDAKLCSNEAIGLTSDVLQGCQDAFRDVDEALKSSMKFGTDGKWSVTRTGRLLWPLKSNKLELLRANLEKLKTTLLLLLSVLSYGRKVLSQQSSKAKSETELSLDKLQIQNLVQARDDATKRYTEMSSAFSKLEARLAADVVNPPPPSYSAAKPPSQQWSAFLATFATVPDHSRDAGTSQWTPERVQKWLSIHSFSREWQAALLDLRVCGPAFLALGGKGGLSNSTGTSIILQVREECIARGIRWDAAKGEEEAKRLAKLVREEISALSGTMQSLNPSLNANRDDAPSTPNITGMRPEHDQAAGGVAARLGLCAAVVTQLAATIDVATHRWHALQVLEQHSISASLRDAIEAIEGLASSNDPPRPNLHGALRFGSSAVKGTSLSEETLAKMKAVSLSRQTSQGQGPSDSVTKSPWAATLSGASVVGPKSKPPLRLQTPGLPSSPPKRQGISLAERRGLKLSAGPSPILSDDCISGEMPPPVTTFSLSEGDELWDAESSEAISYSRGQALEQGYQIQKSSAATNSSTALVDPPEQKAEHDIVDDLLRRWTTVAI